MRLSQSGSIIGSVLGIVVCGAIGGFTAWVIVTQLHWNSPFGALVAVFSAWRRDGSMDRVDVALRGLRGKR